MMAVISSLIVLAVSKRRALGVDVENVRAGRASIDVADRYFAPQEVAALRAMPRIHDPPRSCSSLSMYTPHPVEGVAIATERLLLRVTVSAARLTGPASSACSINQ